MSDAWDEYWAGGATQPSGCLPTGLAAIDAEQTRRWRIVAKGLPKGARVLDLATGDGVVLRKLSGVRRDLTLTGVDSARTLPPAPRGVRLKSGVAAEALPLPDASVDLVTSQFGFEYTDMAAAAAEVARVLRPRGRVAFLTHRADSPILTHNRTRRDGLRWALDEAEVLAHARAAVGGLALGADVPDAVIRAPANAITHFGAGSGAWELAEAARIALKGAGSRPSTLTLAALEDLDRLARNEVGRIDSLERACAAAGRGRPVAAALAAAGLKTDPVEPVAAPGTGPFGCWVLARRD